MLSYESAKARDVSSLQNWVDGTGSISREETAYLTRRTELLSIAFTDDCAASWMETLVEDSLVRLREFFRLVRKCPTDVTDIGY